MHKLRPWLVESHAVSALWADATSHLLSPLAHPGSVVLPNSPSLQRAVKNSHKLNRWRAGGFTVSSPAAGP